MGKIMSSIVRDIWRRRKIDRLTYKPHHDNEQHTEVLGITQPGNTQKEQKTVKAYA